MKAMLLNRTGRIDTGDISARPAAKTGGSLPLQLSDVPVPGPGPDEILIRITACGVCHTELDQIEGRIAPPRLPVIP